jgi:uncharacterized protein
LPRACNMQEVGAIPQLSHFFLFGIIAFALLAIAKQKGFFLISSRREASVEFKYVLLAFFIYLFINIALPPILVQFHFFKSLKDQDIALTGLINLINNLFISFGLFLLCIKLPKNVFKNIWNEEPNLSFNIKIGFITWFLAFFSVTFLSNFLEYFTMIAFNIKELPDQIAIQYMKGALKNPFYLVTALLTVVIFAPVIEELLFRGFLQTFLKNSMKRKSAIIITSILFALFHFSPSQKLSNFTLLISLFVLSCFLGFLYERQKSLIAPIVLHSTFNFMSILNLFFFKG